MVNVSSFGIPWSWTKMTRWIKIILHTLIYYNIYYDIMVASITIMVLFNWLTAVLDYLI